MKIVLSRKGLDSEYGGIPSPVIKNGKGEWMYIPIPIPSPHTNDIKYSELSWPEEFKNPSSFYEKITLKSEKTEHCHLDPDINRDYLNDRHDEWTPNFGQVKSAQSHLKNNQIGANDIFLFFGWFKKYEYSNGMYKPINDGFPNGFHAIYGYLQIEKKLSIIINDEIPEWLKYHPHFKNKEHKEFNHINNSIYIANKYFNHSKVNNKKGANIFKFDEKLVLTNPNDDKARRSYWRFPETFSINNVDLTYNTNRIKWSIKDGNVLLQSACKGQEFVFNDDTGTVEDWCINLINEFSV